MNNLVGNIAPNMKSSSINYAIFRALNGVVLASDATVTSIMNLISPKYKRFFLRLCQLEDEYITSMMYFAFYYSKFKGKRTTMDIKIMVFISNSLNHVETGTRITSKLNNPIGIAKNRFN